MYVYANFVHTFYLRLSLALVLPTYIKMRKYLKSYFIEAIKFKFNYYF